MHNNEDEIVQHVLTFDDENIVDMMKDTYLVERLSEYTINVMFKHAEPFIKAKFEKYQK